MIAITSHTYDLLGLLMVDGAVVRSRSDQRRASVTRTLDGNVVLDDAGYHPGDRPREFVVRNPTAEQIDRARRLVTLHSDHRLFEGDAVYTGSLSVSNYRPPTLSLTFNIEEQEA